MEKLNHYLQSKKLLQIFCLLIPLFLQISSISIQKQEDFRDIEILTQQFLNNKTFPGVQIGVFKSNQLIYKNYFGNLTYPGDLFNEKVDENKIYDMASCTKVIAVTSAIMILYDQQKIKLDDYLIKYIPEANNNGKNYIQIQNLLLHNAGIQDMYPFGPNPTIQREELLNWTYNLPLIYPVGQNYSYSDMSYIFLQLIIEKITNQSLFQFVKTQIFDKMGMKNTFFTPQLIFQAQNDCPPTEIDNSFRAQTLRCVVQDPTAYILGGVAGNAGLFSNLNDSIIFMQMMLRQGVYIDDQQKETRIFQESTVKLFTKKVVKLPYNNTRGLGWETVPNEFPCPCGQNFSQNSYGHTGFTGTLLYADKDKDLGIVILTNRVYPDGGNLVSQKSNMWYRNNIVNLIIKKLQIE